MTFLKQTIGNRSVWPRTSYSTSSNQSSHKMEWDHFSIVSPVIVLFAIDIPIPREASQLSCQWHTTMTASQATAVPGPVGGSEIPAFRNFPAASSAVEGVLRVVGVVTGDHLLSGAHHCTTLGRGCAVAAANFLQHLSCARKPLLLDDRCIVLEQKTRNSWYIEYSECTSILQTKILFWF